MNTVEQYYDDLCDGFHLPAGAELHGACDLCCMSGARHNVEMIAIIFQVPYNIAMSMPELPVLL